MTRPEGQRQIVSVVGARPQFVKLAAMDRAFRKAEGVTHRIVHTGQHFDAAMSDVFFEEMGIPAPDAHFGIGGLSHGAMTGRMIEACERDFQATRPDAVLAYGDTNSTIACALAAVKLGLPLCHLEAGLRSFDRTMPEEVNRVLTDACADLLLCPTRAAVDNLRAEGAIGRIEPVGDVMHDVALDAARRVEGRDAVLERAGVAEGGYVLATVHRAENTADAARLRRVLNCLRETAAGRPVVLPLHPRTRAAAERFGLDLAPIRAIEPVGYLDMTRLIRGCALVMTDSGGLQKEAYFHGRRCVTLRDRTEWVETIACGWNRLWTDEGYAPKRPIPEYGDGHAAEAAVAAILDHLAQHPRTRAA